MNWYDSIGFLLWFLVGLAFLRTAIRSTIKKVKFFAKTSATIIFLIAAAKLYNVFYGSLDPFAEIL